MLISYIPCGKISQVKSSHPWLNEEIKKAIRRKNDAEGTNAYQEACDLCTSLIAEARKEYTEK